MKTAVFPAGLFTAVSLTGATGIVLVRPYPGQKRDGKKKRVIGYVANRHTTLRVLKTARIPGALAATFYKC